MTGPHDSVIGIERAAIIQRFLTGLPQRFEVGVGQPAPERRAREGGRTDGPRALDRTRQPVGAADRESGRPAGRGALTMADWRSLPFDDDDAGPAEPAGPLSVSELTARFKSLVEERVRPGRGRRRDLQLPAVEFRPHLLHAEGRLCAAARGDVPHAGAPAEVPSRGRPARGRQRPPERVRGQGRLPVGRRRDGAARLGRAAGRVRAAQARGCRPMDCSTRSASAPLPVLPRRIGVVTSGDGAALRDILRILTTRHPSARIVVRPARVQGEDAPTDLVRALTAIAAVPEMDVVIIGRGGGSAEDLWAFNDERLARAIAACPGAGHFRRRATRRTSRSRTSSPTCARPRRRTRRNWWSIAPTTSAPGSIARPNG